MRILLVEDEYDLGAALERSLKREKYVVDWVKDGAEAWQFLENGWNQYTVAIFDWLLPGLSGIELCQRLRAKQNPLPVLMLTARDRMEDRVMGLDAGADDYLVKPFSPTELVARVRALLRRSLRHGGQHLVYHTQHFAVDMDQRTASRQTNSDKTEVLDLTTLEFNLLATFMSYPGRVWSREQLIDKLWGSDFFGDDRVVDTHIARLRKKIELEPANPNFIKTVIGIGYKFED